MLAGLDRHVRDLVHVHNAVCGVEPHWRRVRSHDCILLGSISLADEVAACPRVKDEPQVPDRDSGPQRAGIDVEP